MLLCLQTTVRPTLSGGIILPAEIIRPVTRFPENDNLGISSETTRSAAGTDQFEVSPTTKTLAEQLALHEQRGDPPPNTREQQPSQSNQRTTKITLTLSPLRQIISPREEEATVQQPTR